MSADRIEAFAEQFEQVAHERLTPDDLIPEVRIDLDLSLDQIGEELESLIRHFEPFGIGNPAPTFTCTGARLFAPARRVGADGLRLSLSRSNGAIEGIGWGLAGRAHELDVGKPFDIAFRIERDEFRGVSRLQLKLADFRV